MTAPGLGCRKSLVGTRWAISLLFCRNWGNETFFLVCTSNYWLRTMSIESSLTNVHGRRYNLYRMAAIGTCVKLEASKPM